MKENIKIMISAEEINLRLKELGEQISKDYEGKTVTMVCVLKGAIAFLVDLGRNISTNVEFDFINASSYGDSTQSSGIVKIIKDLDHSIEGKDVIIVEDIIDTGITLDFLYKHLSSHNPRSLKICTLLDKPDRREVKDIKVDYTGFTIPDEFVIGYGLDYAQKYRNLPYIGILSFE